MWQFGTSVINVVVWQRKLREVENECILHNSSLFAIFLPKIIKIGGNLMKCWQKQFCTVFVTWRSCSNADAMQIQTHCTIVQARISPIQWCMCVLQGGVDFLQENLVTLCGTFFLVDDIYGFSGQDIQHGNRGLLIIPSSWARSMATWHPYLTRASIQASLPTSDGSVSVSVFLYFFGIFKVGSVSIFQDIGIGIWHYSTFALF